MDGVFAVYSTLGRMNARLTIVAAIAVILTISSRWVCASDSDIPSPEMVSEGSVVVEWLQNVFKLSSLLPDDLRRMDVDVQLRNVSEVNNDQINAKTQNYAVASGIPYARDVQISYRVGWGFLDNNGAQLVLQFHSGKGPCITEELLKARLGNKFDKRWRPIMRDYFGDKPPTVEKIYPKDQFITYTTPGNIVLTFWYEYTCANALYIIDRRPTIWNPAHDGNEPH